MQKVEIFLKLHVYVWHNGSMDLFAVEVAAVPFLAAVVVVFAVVAFEVVEPVAVAAAVGE